MKKYRIVLNPKENSKIEEKKPKKKGTKNNNKIVDLNPVIFIIITHVHSQNMPI